MTRFGSPKPKDGKDAYWCKPCRRLHLRWSIVGRMHKAYFQKAGGKRERVE